MEPFSFKLPFKETMSKKKKARPLKNPGKLGKNVPLLSFLKSRLTPKVGEKISSLHSSEKFLSQL
jgi:hypothetical protein